MTDQQRNVQTLKHYALEQGISVFGVAPFDPTEARSRLLDREGGRLPYAISMGIQLSWGVLDGIIDHPTLLYKWHYRQANIVLDRVAFQMTLMIQEMGGKAVPIPASQIVDWETQRGHLSHKHVGVMAGHGWIGRNNLLVHPQFGSGVRYVTILTDLPLVVDRPVQGDCGRCRACVEVCPAGALGETPEQYDFHKCFEQLRYFSKQRGIGQYICGVCVRACRGALWAGGDAG